MPITEPRQEWFAVCVKLGGRLISVGTVVGDDLPPEWEVLDLSAPPRDDQVWDEESKSFVDRPAHEIKDRLADFYADGNWPWMNLGDRGQIDEVLKRLLPYEHRYY